MKALYRKYRPITFDEVVGQEQVTNILKLAIANKRIGHSYLLVGPRGVGKTSVARILAHNINQLPYELDHTHIDIIEIDAASNTSVDNIRDIIEKACIAPAQAKYKIYIIDEVHMLSKSAFNAFLKLLEEPPQHVIFILATTDEHKIPATIISRAQRFVFRKIDNQTIAKQLRKIANAEDITVTDQGLEVLSRAATGGLRDAINLLDQVASLSGSDQPIDQQLINQLTGTIDQQKLETLLDYYHHNDLFKMIELTDQLLADNFTSVEIAKQLAQIAKAQLFQDASNLHLIDRLLQVETSSLPDLELIVALGSGFKASTLPLQNTTSTASANPVQESTAISPDSAQTQDLTPASFPKEQFLQIIKERHPALFGILQQAKIDFQQNVLEIKAEKTFAFKRLSDPKHSASLRATLAELGFDKVELKLVDPALVTDHKTQQLKSVMDIMGGGEEVKLDE